MRKLYIIAALLASVTASAQPNRVVQQQESYITIQFRGGFKADSALTLPVRDTSVYFPSAQFGARGQMVLRPSDSLVYYYTGRQWKQVGSGSGGSTVVNWSDVQGKPATFPTTPAQIASGGASSGQVLKYNGSAWVPATDQTGGGGGVTGSDSSLNILRAGLQNPGTYLARYANIKDSMYFAYLPGIAEFDIDWFPGTVNGMATGIFSYDDQLGSRGCIITANKDSFAIQSRLRTYQQLLANIQDTQYDSTFADNGIHNVGPDAQKHYPSIVISKDSIITLYYYVFGVGTYSQSGRSIKEVRTAPKVQLPGYLNDAQVEFNPKGGYSMAVKDLENDAAWAILNAPATGGQFAKQSDLMHAGSEDSSFAIRQFADPLINYIGKDHALLFGTSHAYETQAGELYIRDGIPSNKWVQEVTANHEGDIRPIGRPVAITGTYWYGNPVPFINPVTGKEYLAYTKPASPYPNQESGVQPNPDMTLSDMGKLILSQLSDKTEMPNHRDADNIIQFTAGVKNEIVSNLAPRTYGTVVNSIDSGISTHSINSGMWGATNYTAWENSRTEADFVIDAAPSGGQVAYLMNIESQKPTLDKSAYGIIINSSAQVAVRYTLPDGTVNTSDFVPCGIGVRCHLVHTDNGGNKLLTVNDQAATPFLPGRFNRMCIYSVMNRGTDSTAKANQFIGRVYSLNMKKLPATSPVVITATTATISPSNRKVTADASNGAITLTLPTATVSGYGYTGKAVDDYYQVTKNGGALVTIPQVSKSLTANGETVIIRYTASEGYKVIASTPAQGVSGSGNYITSTNGTVSAISTFDYVLKDSMKAYVKHYVDSALDTVTRTSGIPPALGPMMYWGRADTTANTYVGATIDVLKDLSGSGNDMAPFNSSFRPQYYTSGGLNGIPYAGFDGFTQSLYRANFAIPGATTDVTMFVVARIYSASGFAVLAELSPNQDARTDAFILGLNESGSIGTLCPKATGDVGTSGRAVNTSVGQWAIIEVRYWKSETTDEVKVRVNGGAWGTLNPQALGNPNNTNSFATSQPLNIGARSVSSAMAQMHLAEMQMYSGKIADGSFNRKLLINYFNNRYGTSLPTN